MTFLKIFFYFIFISQDDGTKDAGEANDAAGLIELLEDDSETITNTPNESAKGPENNEPSGENEVESMDDEIIEINGDEIMGDDEPTEKVLKIKVEDDEDDSQNNDSDDEKEDDAGAHLDENDEEYDGERASKYKNKKERKIKKASSAPKKFKKSKEVLIPQMVIIFYVDCRRMIIRLRS